MKKFLIYLLLLLPGLLQLPASQAQVPLSLPAMKAVITQKVTPVGAARVTAQATREAMNTLAEQIDLANQALAAANVRVDGISSGSGNDYTTYVKVKTRAGIQAAVDAAPAGSTLVLSGVYDCSAGAITINKPLRLTGFNAVLDGKTTNHVLIVSNNHSGMIIEYIKFQSMDTGSGYSMLLFNELGAVKNLTIQHCEFTCPVGLYNAISFTAFSEASQQGVAYENIVITDCYAHDLNRMFAEFVSHNWSQNVVLIKGITFSNNRVINSGTNSNDGMAVSFSGPIENVVVNGNRMIQVRGYGAEFIGTIGFTATGNTIISDKMQSNGDPTNGYNLTDGNHTADGIPGKGARGGSITGGRVEVSGRPFLGYYCYDIEITGGTWKGIFTTLQHCERISLTGLKFDSTKETCLYFDGTNNSTVTGGTYSTVNATGAKYQQIAFVNGSTGNVVTGSRLDGVPANGVHIFPAGDANNHWANVFTEGAFINN